jgi:hypothetical protein
LLLRPAGRPGAAAAGRQLAQPEFREYDLGDDGHARVVDRPYGNTSAIVFRTITTPATRYL